MSHIVRKFNSYLPELNNVKISDMIQGDIWIVPNKANIDSVILKGSNDVIVTPFNKYRIKKKNEPIKTLSQIEKEGICIYNHDNFKLNDRSKYIKTSNITQKINSYVPDTIDARW